MDAESTLSNAGLIYNGKVRPRARVVAAAYLDEIPLRR